MKTLLLLACLLLPAPSVLAQPLLSPQPGDCPEGRCRWTPVRDAAAAAELKADETDDTRALVARAVGYCRVRVLTNVGITLQGSAVCVGRRPAENPPRQPRWVFLSAGHIFEKLPNSARIQLDVASQWRSAQLVTQDLKPDRAILLLATEDPLTAPAIAQADEATGQAVMVGYPRGGDARAFLGTVAANAPRLSWMTLRRRSHFDCLVGASGGGVYDPVGRLIGIQSCADSRGEVSRIGFTPIAAWDPLFVKLGWCPRGWGRDCQPRAAAPECSQGPRGPRGERGPAGPPGPALTPAQVQQAVAAYLAQHPPEVDRSELEQVVIDLLATEQTQPVDLGPVQRRLHAIEQQLDVPFEVQLLNAGSKVGSPRFVRPHGGYLPLDVFGDVETVTEPARGE